MYFKDRKAKFILIYLLQRSMQFHEKREQKLVLNIVKITPVFWPTLSSNLMWLRTRDYKTNQNSGNGFTGWQGANYHLTEAMVKFTKLQ